MEEDYADDEGLFCFENEEDEAAVMSRLDDEDLEPLTPVGSADASNPAAVHQAAEAAAASGGRIHNTFSTTPAWLYPDRSPSPPPPSLSYSPSPRVTDGCQYRHPDHLGSPGPVDEQDNHTSSRPADTTTSLGHGAHRPPSFSKHSAHYMYPRQLASDALKCQVPGHGTLQQQFDLEYENGQPVSKDEMKDYVEIDVEGVQAMFNGNEADYVTAQKLKGEVVKTVHHGGKVVYMVGQATAQWWLSTEMSKRRRVVGHRMLDMGGAVLTGAGTAIMSKTPVGGVVTSVSNTVSAFRAAPFRYTMQGLGIMKQHGASPVVWLSTGAEEAGLGAGVGTANHAPRSVSPSPTIVEDEDDDILGILQLGDDEEF